MTSRADRTPKISRASLCTIGDCDIPVPSTTYVCNSCIDKLAYLIAVLPSRWRELQRVITKQVSFGGSNNGGKSADTPMMFNTHASDLAWTITNTLTTWVRHVQEERGVCAYPELSGDAVMPMALWLYKAVPWLATRQEGAEAIDELIYCLSRMSGVIDRPADRWYAGPCECGTDLYVRPTANVVTCRNCAESYVVSDRRKWLLEEAEDRLAYAALICRAVSILGEPVSQMQISRWVKRGRLIHRAHDKQKRKLYRVGDVLDLARGEISAQSKREVS